MDLQADACSTSHIVAGRFLTSLLLHHPTPLLPIGHAYNGRVRYLGVDPGGRRMGLAVGDDSTGVASPLEIVPYEGMTRATQLIAAFAKEVGATRVVLGLPTLEDGSRGPACRRTESLAAELGALGIEVALQSEFLSTNEARRRARAAGRSPRRPVDDIAAQILLEDYLTARPLTPAAEN